MKHLFCFSFLLISTFFLGQSGSLTGTWVACGSADLRTVTSMTFEREAGQHCATSACAKTVLELRPDSTHLNLSFTLLNLGCPTLEKKSSNFNGYYKAFGGHWEEDPTGNSASVTVLDVPRKPVVFRVWLEGEVLRMEAMTAD